MQEVITKLEQKHRKPKLADVRSGDTVRVHQLIKEAGKERTQIFEGVVIKTSRMKSLTASITVRRIASGIGVEKTFQLHAPNVQKIDIRRRSKVRRNYLSYLRERQGKSARMQDVAFDRDLANSTEASIEEPTEELRKEEVSEKASSEATKQEAENAKADEPKSAKEADSTATTKNQADTKESKPKEEANKADDKKEAKNSKESKNNKKEDSK